MKKMTKTFENEVMGEAPPECEICGDTGEVPCDEEDGEGHTMRGVSTRKCICRRNKKQDDEN
jgi:hypothetical protein